VRSHIDQELKFEILGSVFQNVKGALSDKIVNFCYPYKLSDLFDALIKRVSVTYKCYEMYTKLEEILLIWSHFFGIKIGTM
jgi:hypothetical protein